MNKAWIVLVIVVCLTATMAGCTSDSGYSPGGTLSNIIDSTKAENVIVEIPLEVQIEIDGNKVEKRVETVRYNYDTTNYSATYKATVKPLDEANSRSSADNAPDPKYADDETLLQEADQMMLQRIDIGETTEGLFSGDRPEFIDSIIEGGDGWEGVFGGLSSVRPFGGLDSVIDSNRAMVDRGPVGGAVDANIQAFVSTIQSKAMFQAERVHIVELPVYINTTFKDLNGEVIDTQMIKLIIYVPVEGVTEVDGEDIVHTYYPEIKYVSPLGWATEGHIDIEVVGTEAEGYDWAYLVDPHKVSPLEGFLRTVHRGFSDVVAWGTFGYVVLDAPLSDEDAPVPQRKNNLDLRYLEDDEDIGVIDSLKGLGLRNYLYQLIPGGGDAGGSSSVPGFEAGFMVAALVGVVTFIRYGRRTDKNGNRP